MAFAPVVGGGVEPSYFRLMLQANVDHIAGNAFEGDIVRSGPTRISLYEVFRDSPEGTAYRSYHERYAADHDWTLPGKAIVTPEQATSSGES
jgi:hypothetical protein